MARAENAVQIERDSAVVWLTLNRPEAANALDHATHEALHDALDMAAVDNGVRVVLLAAAGRKVFCAGADLKELARLGKGDPTDVAAATQRASELLLRTLLALLDFPKPVLCVLQGQAVGAGAMLALACDQIVAAPGAAFRFPEISLAIPSPMGIAMLESRAPRGVVWRMVQEGTSLDAQALLKAGLIDAIVPDEQIADHARTLARGMHAGSACATNKRWLNRGLREKLVEAARESRRLRESGVPAKDSHAT